MPQDAPPNCSAQDQEPEGPWSRVAGMQAKLHRWAAADPGRRSMTCSTSCMTRRRCMWRSAGSRATGREHARRGRTTVALVGQRIGVQGVPVPISSPQQQAGMSNQEVIGVNDYGGCWLMARADVVARGLPKS